MDSPDQHQFEGFPGRPTLLDDPQMVYPRGQITLVYRNTANPLR
jgi:hypothetical protein